MNKFQINFQQQKNKLYFKQLKKQQYSKRFSNVSREQYSQNLYQRPKKYTPKPSQNLIQSVYSNLNKFIPDKTKKQKTKNSQNSKKKLKINTKVTQPNIINLRSPKSMLLRQKKKNKTKTAKNLHSVLLDQAQIKNPKNKNQKNLKNQKDIKNSKKKEQVFQQPTKDIQIDLELNQSIDSVKIQHQRKNLILKKYKNQNRQLINSYVGPQPHRLVDLNLNEKNEFRNSTKSQTKLKNLRQVKKQTDSLNSDLGELEQDPEDENLSFTNAKFF